MAGESKPIFNIETGKPSKKIAISKKAFATRYTETKAPDGEVTYHKESSRHVTDGGTSETLT